MVALVGAFALPSVVNAQTATVTVTATVGSSLAISVGSGTAALALTPGAAPATATTTITATSNDISGYNISAESDSAGSNSSLYKNATNALTAAGVNLGTAPAANSNTWGLYVSTKPAAGTSAIDAGYDGDATAPVAVATTADRIGYNSATAPSGEAWVVTYTAAASVARETGAYATVVTYTIAAGVGS